MVRVVSLYRFAISSDEEEIFSKGANQGTKLIPVRKMTTLSKRSPNMSHADWAVENMSRSPGSECVFVYSGNFYSCHTQHLEKWLKNTRKHWMKM